MQRTATAGFYAGFVGQGIEYTQIISNADYQLSMIITSAKGVNSINNPLSYLLFIKDFSLTQTIDAAKAGLQDAWNGTYDSAIGRKIGAGTFNYLLMTIGGAQLKGKGTACKAVESGSDSVKNWKGQEVKVPDGHIMSPRDPSFSAKPITEAGPYTLAQRDAFLAGNSAGTKLAPHHRHQIPVRDGGVIDELPGPGHPSGNQHTAGSPSRHPAKSIFNSERSGNVLRANEITQHWIDKGNRLIEVEPGVWIDPGF